MWFIVKKESIMHKKIFTIIVIIAAMLLSACVQTSTQSVTQSSQQANENGEKQTIVVSAFHEYDWVLNILGDKTDDYNLILLMDSGVDMHSYEPSVADVATILSADLFIYNGGPSQTWVADAIEQPTNEKFTAVNIMESLGDAVMAEVMVEGMQSSEHNHEHAEDAHDHAEDDHDHAEDAHADHDHAEDEHADHDHAEDEDEHAEDDHDHAEDDHDHAEEEHEHAEDEHDHAEEEHDHAEDEHEAHDDEHIWLSLNNAIFACEIIGDAIAQLNPENAEVYSNNTLEYTNQLKTLHEEYETAIEQAQRDTLLFTDRFPFLYMMQDYDVNYYAPFQGCDAETEATIETVAFLADKVNEFDINTLLILDNGLVELAQTVNDNSNDKDSEVLILHSMQSVSAQDIEAGATYLGFMQENLDTIKIALAE